jgi:hypothetical protein
MRKIRHDSGMWKYLDELGVLEKGTEEEILAARRTYKKKYLLDYRRKQRKEGKEITVFFKKGEEREISEAAKSHRMTINRFLKTATLAYLSQTYIVPDREVVAGLEQALIQILNEIQTLAKRSKILYSLNPEAIEARIGRMEEMIAETLRTPPTIEQYIEKNPELKEKIIRLLKDDHKGQNPQNPELPTAP